MATGQDQPGKGGLRVRPATERDREIWDGYVLAHPWGSPYHLFAWKEAIERAYGFPCQCLLAEDGLGVRGVLPFTHIRSPLCGGSIVSLPYCDYGGAAADAPNVARELLQGAADRTAASDGILLEHRSPTSLPGLEGGEFRLETKARLVLDLPSSSEALFSGFKAKLRSQVRKPLRDGLTANVGGSEHLDEFYKVFCRNMRDLGSAAHSRQWFRILLQEYGERMRICVVRMLDGAPAAAGVMLCTRHSVTVPWASSLRELNRWNPNMLLYWTMLAHAADGGWDWFDFGRSTPGEGTWKFKRQWGAEPFPLHWGRFRVEDGELSPLPLKESNGAGGCGRAFVEGVVRRLPVPVATFLGSRVRKYISL
jgi:FemAB-related protein (PEP-CTERM system-associated)